MPREVAYHLLAAEAQAWPIASIASFTHKTIELERQYPGVLSPSTELLAHALEDRLRPRASGMSVEILRQLRDHSWFASLAYSRTPNLSSVLLADYLHHLANEYLEHRGRSVSLRYRPVSHIVDADRFDEAECAARWRWLSFFLPPDLLIGALYAGTGFEPVTDQVSLVTPHLAHVLLREVADTHLHLGAAFSFDRLWASLMRALAGNLLGLKKIRAATSTPFGDGERLCRLLLAAAIVRTLMAAFLWDRASGGRSRSFTKFWIAAGGVFQIAQALRWPQGDRQGFAQLSNALAVLVADDARTRLGTLHAVYQRMIGPRPRRRPGTVDPLNDDPLADWLGASSAEASPETRFVTRAIFYLRSSADRDFALAFWQYQRVRCQTYQYLVEEPSTAGLDWFKRHYDRLQLFRGPLDSSAVLAALRLESSDIGLGAMEVRTAPADRWQEAREMLRRVAGQAASYIPTPDKIRPEIGVILHFIKEERCGCGRALADPRHRAYNSRYAPWFIRRQQQALAIETLLRHHPEYLLLLRGIDVASAELAVPNWVLVPLFRGIDRAAIDAAARLARQEPTWQVPALRHTVHAGEDYRRLAEGLRRIHEAVEFGLLRPGDRIGHGFALGVDPARWAVAARTVAQPREERLDDLLWELQRYGSAEWAPDSARLEFTRAEVVRLAREIYQGEFINLDNITPDKLIQARNLRHDADFLNHLGYPFMQTRPPREESPELLAWLYLVDGTVFERGQIPELVHADASEVAALLAAQRWLSQLLGRLEITIESNPSSNLLIGDLLQLEDHPLFRLQPLSGQPCPNGSTILVSINDDDPVTFATRVADEFAHLYFALLRRGVAAQDALHFIGTIRENGWRSRFTLDSSKDLKILERLAERR